jgi:peptide methionine sulfoxide reductase msrA/msrB
MKIFILLFLTFFLIGCTNTITNTNNEEVIIEDNSEEVKMVEEKLAKATFAGGCFWCMESDFEKLKGVKEVISGYSGGDKVDPSYKEVSSGATRHREVVQIIYNPNIISYSVLLEHFWKNVDPLNEKGQFCDEGFQYTSAIFYHNEKQKKLAEESKKKVEEVLGGDIFTEISEIKEFYSAEEYHQDYYKKSPVRYKTYRKLCGRDKRLSGLWENKNIGIGSSNDIFIKPSDEELKEILTPIQYKVTQKEGTERAFNNEYWDNHEEGIYVDIVSGEVLFSSNEKFDSGTGWPSFTQPIEPDNIITKKDYKLIVPRTEVRSKQADSHLGHILLDGPEWNDKIRYCMNSAALRFIPKENFEKEGYEKYKSLFD